jgi:hypothetical protein
VVAVHPSVLWTLVASLLLGCRAEPRSVPVDAVAPQPSQPTASEPPPLLVEAGATAEAGSPAALAILLHWRESGRRATRDASGNEHWSVELELLVQGGIPSSVRLGRRRAYGFTPMPADPDALASVQSYIDAHGEYATVKRGRAGELRVEAYGQDEAFPEHVPPTTNVRTAVVRIPADAGVEVEETVEEADAG